MVQRSPSTDPEHRLWAPATLATTLHLTQVECKRIERATASPVEQASKRLAAKASGAKPWALMTPAEKAEQRLGAALRARFLREPTTAAEKAEARLEAAKPRKAPRALMSEEQRVAMRLQDAARQQRHRASLSDRDLAGLRRKDAERKRQERASPQYRGLPPEIKWKKKGRSGTHLSQRPFVGVDGEAGYDHPPDCGVRVRGWCECRQQYAALTVGEQTLINPDGRRLTTWQCLEFLMSAPRDRRYVGFFFNFDVTHILRDVPPDILYHIVQPDRSPKPRDDKCVYVRDPATGISYGIRYVPHKFLTVVKPGEPVHDPYGLVTRDRRGHIKRTGGRRLTIFDCAGYWQTSFHQAITTWGVGTAEERDIIAKWKSKRNDFPLPLTQGVIDYNVLECKLLAELMTRLDVMARSHGITLRSYHGAGTLANGLLIQHGVEAFRGDPGERSEELQHAIRCAFFGGRFESAVVGVLPALHVWDIASAYPAAMTTLPCLHHGEWVHHKPVPPLHVLSDSTMVYTRWDVWPSEQRPFGPLPYRCENGELFYPLSGVGWYWVEELRSATNYRSEDGFEVVEAWEWRPTCDHRPFSWVEDSYQTRLDLGKNAAGMVLKYGLNSLYGKMAQRLGGGGRFTEFVWAGMITARTRAKLLDVAALGGAHVVMFATDGVGYDSLPPELEAISTYTGKVPLGSWEYDPSGGGIHRKVLMVQSGFYIDGERTSRAGRASEPPPPRDRARGVGTKVLEAMDGRRRLYAAFRHDGAEARVRFGPEHVVPAKSVPMIFRGLRTAFHRNQPWIAGTWVPVEKEICFAPEPKRERLPRRAGETFIRTVPTMSAGARSGLGVMPLIRTPSAPYKRLAHKQDEKDLYYDQPDHVDGLALLVGDDL